MVVRNLKNRAARLFERGRFKECAEVRKQLVAFDQADPWLRLRCAEAHVKAGEFDEAKNWFIQTAKAFVARGQLRHARAVIAAAEKQLGHAIDAVDALSAPKPRSVALIPYVGEPMVEIEVDPYADLEIEECIELIDEDAFCKIYVERDVAVSSACSFFAAITYPPTSSEE